MKAINKAALLLGAYGIAAMTSDLVPTESNKNTYSKTTLTKKQKKVRAKNKRAKKSRRINRK